MPVAHVNETASHVCRRGIMAQGTAKICAWPSHALPENPDGFRPLRVFFYLAILLTIDCYTMPAQNLTDNRTMKFLALGDSYTIGESVAEDQRWPVQLMNALRKNNVTFEASTIVATTGWRTDQLTDAIEARNLARNYDVVSLLIGVNNQYQGRSISEYQKEFSKLLQIAIDHAGGDKSRVFVLSIPDYGYTPFGKEKQEAISKAIDAFNEVNRTITEKNGVKYINITDISRRGLADPDLVAGDGLHPSAKMYNLWVERIIERLF